MRRREEPETVAALHRRGVRRRSAAALALSALVMCCPAPGSEMPPLPAPETFDGSFRLSTGELLTGGYFVEGGQPRYIYLNPEDPGLGGLFERAGPGRLRSIVPPGRVELEFPRALGEAGPALVWRERGKAAVPATRVYPHRSEPVSFRSADGTRLEGRLLVPDCPGPHPAVVAVHGSGPVNRFGGPYHTFFLTRGMAVLAYDKRGYSADVGSWREPDLAALAADAAAALKLAAELPGIDRDRLGLFGSSQAGWVAPRAAVEFGRAAFLVLRAGAAVSQLETVLHERRQELRLRGLHGLALDSAMDLRREIYELAIAGKPLSSTDRLVAPYLEEPWYRTAFGEGPVSRSWSPDWWDWAGRNLPVSAIGDLERFAGPVLWFLGELDEAVPLVRTRAALERAFARSPGGRQQVRVVPNAPHSFLVSAEDGTPVLSPDFFRPMGEWLDARGLSDGRCWQDSVAPGED